MFRKIQNETSVFPDELAAELPADLQRERRRRQIASRRNSSFQRTRADALLRSRFAVPRHSQPNVAACRNESNVDDELDRRHERFHRIGEFASGDGNFAERKSERVAEQNVEWYHSNEILLRPTDAFVRTDDQRPN